MAKILPALPDSPRTKVFRAIVGILRHDTVLNSIFKPGSLRSWSGDSHDNIEFTVSSAPAIRLTPAAGPEQFWSPNAMVGALLINCEMLVPGTCVDDLQNLWWAIEKAIYPATNAAAAANVTALQNAGAHSGLVLFSQPAYDDQPSDRLLLGMGQMKIDVRLQFN